MSKTTEATGNNDNIQETAGDGSLFRLYEQMLGDVKVENVLKNATKVVGNILNAERATTYLVHEDSQELESAAVIGNVSRIIRLPISDDSIAGYCAYTRESLVIPDAYGDLSNIHPKLRFDRSWDEINKFRTRDVMCAPAIFRDELMGVVQVMNSKGNPFQQTDINALNSVCRFVAYALYHAKLYDDLATLKCLDKEKAEFMRIMVHELRSPVAASKQLSSALRFTNREDLKLCNAMSKIENRMDQLLGLIGDILQLSQIKAGHPLSEIAIYDLTAETRTTCEQYREQAEAKGLSMIMNLSETPVRVRIDKNGYHLILSNLVSNALKYTPSGSIKVDFRKEDSCAVLEVVDTGMGIPEPDIPKLFGEFFRASNARQNQVPGNGVGLAGVKELVERFRGELTFDSKENEGSSFRVRLPIQET